MSEIKELDLPLSSDIKSIRAIDSTDTSVQVPLNSAINIMGINNKSDKAHNHTGVYQPVGSYALSGHNHTGVYQPAGSYALSGHNHAGVYQPVGSYAPLTHNHSELYQPIGSYALSGHNHTGVYQPAGSYALSGHNHTGVYQPAGSYAPLVHNHAELYQPIGSYAAGNHNHSGVYQPAGNYATTNQLAEKADKTYTDKTFLPLSGGVITGDLNINNQWLRNVQNISFYSDIRLKENIAEIDQAQEADFFEFAPKTYSFKESPERVEIGFVAQEIERIRHYGSILVTTDKESGLKTMDYKALAIMQINQLHQMVVRLKEEVESLKNSAK